VATKWLRNALVALGVTVATVPLVPRPAAADGPTIIGAGSSFMKLEMDQWRAEVARQPYGLKINYAAQGSSFGREQYRGGNIDFAGSDIPFLQAELAGTWPRGPQDFVYVPVSAGGLGFMYNITDQSGQRVTSLKLTRAAVCTIFTTPGGLFWDDPMFATVNPGVELPHEPVVPIVRSDGSGTSYVFSEYCKTAEPNIWQAFRAFLGTTGQLGDDQELSADRPTSTWPVVNGMLAAISADGVAASVADPTSGEGRITYNEAGFAKVRGFPNAFVQNSADQYLQPDEPNVNAALSHATGRPDGTFQLDYTTPDPTAYFPSTYSYVIAQTTGFPPDKGAVLARFLCYAVTKGQRSDLVVALAYARLSQQLVDIARDSIAKIPGAPPWDQCAVPDATSTPPTTVVVVIGGGAGGGGGTGGGGSSGGSGGTGGSGGGSGGGTASGGTGGPTTARGSATTVAGATTTTVPCTTTTTTALCDSTTVGTAVAPSGTPVAAASPGITAAPAGGASGSETATTVAANAESSAPGNQQVAWVLLQGGGICAAGTLFAGLRRRLAP
jgi:ABC-type phosphate transport system substrate-binding protein